MDRTDFEQWKGREVSRLLALVETERRYYQEMVATLPVAIAVLSGDRSIVLANRAFRQMFGLRGDEVRRKQIEQILPSAELIEKIRSVHLETGAESGRGLTLEFAGKLLRVDARPIRSWDEDMELETLLAIQDWTDAGRSGAIPVATFAGAPVTPARPAAPVFPNADLPAIVWQADAATLRFSAISGSAHGTLGVAPSHWLETDGFFEQRIHAEDREPVMALYRSVLEHGGEASAEFRMPAASGDLLWCRETVVVAPPGEASRKLYGVLTFIGERVRLQRQMEIASRHAALNGLAARLAHDLNNPLMLIAGYAEEMAQAFPDGDPRAEDVAQILKATERITELTSHLTRFTRRAPAHTESVNLAAALERLEPRFAGICEEGVAMRIEAGQPLWASADARALEEMLLTLVGAARDCPGCTGLKITCDMAAVAERIPGATLAPGHYARITVEGNGTGVEPAKSISLFESILAKSADNARGESLAQAYTLAREWSGDLAYSGSAESSAFTLYLQTAEPLPPEAVQAPIEEPPPPPEPPHPLILVVDDEPGIRALVAKILRRERYEVIEAGSAADAATVSAAQPRPIELLVTDVMLPDRTGIVLAEQLREQLPNVKVLYMSGYTEDERARAGSFPPGSKFLQKPFTLSALVAKVRESFEQTSLEQT